MGRKTKSTERLLCWLEVNKLNRIGKIISKALIDFGISHQYLTLVINEEQNCFKLKANSRAKDDQWDWTGSINWTKKKDWDGWSTQSEWERKSKTQDLSYWNYETMLS